MSKFKSVIAGLLLMATVVIALGATPSFNSQEVIELTGKNVLIFDQEIDAKTTDYFIAALVGKRLMLPPTETLYILLVSGGGSYIHAKMMRVLISKVPNVVVICKYCGSAAGYLLATAPKRIVMKKSVMIMHEMYMPHYTARMVKQPSVAATLVAESEEFNKVLYDIIGMPKEAYEEKIVNKEWSLTGEDIVKHHIADKFVTIHCSEYMTTLAPDTCSQ